VRIELGAHYQQLIVNLAARLGLRFELLPASAADCNHSFVVFQIGKAEAAFRFALVQGDLTSRKVLVRKLALVSSVAETPRYASRRDCVVNQVPSPRHATFGSCSSAGYRSACILVGMIGRCQQRKQCMTFSALESNAVLAQILLTVNLLYGGRSIYARPKLGSREIHHAAHVRG
jgi:hypothetical protein